MDWLALGISIAGAALAGLAMARANHAAGRLDDLLSGQDRRMDRIEAHTEILGETGGGQPRGDVGGS